MKGDLFINGKDAFDVWGVNIGDNFLESLLLPPPMKALIENKSRLKDGVDVIYDDFKKDERDVTLIFVIQGLNKVDYMEKFKSFVDEISGGKVSIKVPALGKEVYHVHYLRSTSFALNTARTMSKLSVKFNEPNPADRV